MKKLDIAKRSIVLILAITAICILIAAIYYRSRAFFPFLFGALLGGAASILKIVLLERAVDKALVMEKDRVGRHVILQHLLRLGLSAAALLLGALVPQINLWGVVAGILAYPLSLYAVKWMSKGQGG